MKKILHTLVLMALLCFSVACSASTATDNKESGSGEKKEKTQEQLPDKKADKKEEKQAAEKPDKEKAEDEASKEPVEKLYKVSDNRAYIKPLNDEAPEKVVLLTFDDAPDKHAMDIAKTLKEKNVPAIFYVNGHFLTNDEKKDQLKKLKSMGFMIGDHTYSHTNLGKIGPAKQKEEIMKTYNQIKTITGAAPDFFRAPNGTNTDTSDQLTKANHMTVMNWSYGYDFMPKYEDADKLKKMMLGTDLLTNGAILLMHDRPWTAEALPAIIEGLKAKGYSFVDPHTIKLTN